MALRVQTRGPGGTSRKRGAVTFRIEEAPDVGLTARRGPCAGESFRAGNWTITVEEIVPIDAGLIQQHAGGCVRRLSPARRRRRRS
jgi:hypothetical protein